MIWPPAPDEPAIVTGLCSHPGTKSGCHRAAGIAAGPEVQRESSAERPPLAERRILCTVRAEQVSIMSAATATAAPGAQGASLMDPSTWSMAWAAVVVPNAVMMYGHHRGGTLVIVNTVLRHFGVYGLFAVPFVGLTMEKSFYDTALSLQGINPCERAANREGEGFPSGGHALPSLSLVPVKKVI